MKRTIPTAAAVTGFLYAAVAVALSAVFIKLFFESVKTIMEMYGNENYALAFLVFGWLIFLVAAVLLFSAVACIGVAAYSIAAGVLTLNGVKKSKKKCIFVFSVINLVFGAITAVAFLVFALCTLVQMNFDYFGIVSIAGFIVSVFTVIFNSIYIAEN